MKKFKFTVLLLFAWLLALPTAQAQFVLGGGFTAMKFLGDASKRPSALGMDLRIGADINNKARIEVIPALYLPVVYKYSMTLDLNNVPTPANSSEKINIFRTTALFSYDILGQNNKSNVYLSVGPGMVFYNAKLDRSNAETNEALPAYSFKSGYHDLVLDARVGGELHTGITGFFLETGIAPAIVTNLKSNPNYTPQRGAVWMADIGVRFNIGQ